MISELRFPDSHSRRARASDAVLALAMVGITLAGSIGEAVSHVNAIGQTVVTGGRPVVANASWMAFALVAMAAASLAWRRRHPVAVLTFTVTCVGAYSLLGYVNGTALLDVMIALYTVATVRTTRDAVVAAALALVVLMATTAARNPFGALGGGELLIPGEVAASVSLGLALGSRRAYLRAVEDRAAQAERTREEEAARRVDAERLRIARELHDVVAHTLSMINVQAGAAAHVIKERPSEAAEALDNIRVASREGLREMRAMLNVLRQADDADPTQPAPGLALLDDLVATTTRSGLATTVRVEGTPRRLPATVDLAAYRIVQESLTNVVRHARATDATVSLTWRENELLVDVRDTGAGANGSPTEASGAGHGLMGMRERAAAVGGTLAAGPQPGGGFAVHAVLPIGADG